ncbi:hypothetical protein HK102_001542 [Quaeritorhiza haematococci]|nr:hypothetical protein HK102_001542 [Quaeritorhiza haematococci]
MAEYLTGVVEFEDHLFNPPSFPRDAVDQMVPLLRAMGNDYQGQILISDRRDAFHYRATDPDDLGQLERMLRTIVHCAVLQKQRNPGSFDFQQLLQELHLRCKWRPASPNNDSPNGESRDSDVGSGPSADFHAYPGDAHQRDESNATTFSPSSDNFHTHQEHNNQRGGDANHTDTFSAALPGSSMTYHVNTGNANVGDGNNTGGSAAHAQPGNRPNQTLANEEKLPHLNDEWPAFAANASSSTTFTGPSTNHHANTGNVNGQVATNADAPSAYVQPAGRPPPTQTSEERTAVASNRWATYAANVVPEIHPALADQVVGTGGLHRSGRNYNPYDRAPARNTPSTRGRGRGGRGGLRHQTRPETHARHDTLFKRTLHVANSTVLRRDTSHNPPRAEHNIPYVFNHDVRGLPPVPQPPRHGKIWNQPQGDARIPFDPGRAQPTAPVPGNMQQRPTPVPLNAGVRPPFPAHNHQPVNQQQTAARMPFNPNVRPPFLPNEHQPSNQQQSAPRFDPGMRPPLHPVDHELFKEHVRPKLHDEDSPYYPFLGPPPVIRLSPRTKNQTFSRYTVDFLLQIGRALQNRQMDSGNQDQVPRSLSTSPHPPAAANSPTRNQPNVAPAGEASPNGILSGESLASESSNDDWNTAPLPGPTGSRSPMFATGSGRPSLQPQTGPNQVSPQFGNSTGQDPADRSDVGSDSDDDSDDWNAQSLSLPKQEITTRNPPIQPQPLPPRPTATFVPTTTTTTNGTVVPPSSGKPPVAVPTQVTLKPVAPSHDTSFEPATAAAAVPPPPAQPAQVKPLFQTVTAKPVAQTARQPSAQPLVQATARPPAEVGPGPGQATDQPPPAWSYWSGITNTVNWNDKDHEIPLLQYTKPAKLKKKGRLFDPMVEIREPSAISRPLMAPRRQCPADSEPCASIAAPASDWEDRDTSMPKEDKTSQVASWLKGVTDPLPPDEPGGTAATETGLKRQNKPQPQQPRRKRLEEIFGEAPTMLTSTRTVQPAPTVPQSAPSVVSDAGVLEQSMAKLSLASPARPPSIARESAHRTQPITKGVGTNGFHQKRKVPADDKWKHDKFEALEAESRNNNLQPRPALRSSAQGSDSGVVPPLSSAAAPAADYPFDLDGFDEDDPYAMDDPFATMQRNGVRANGSGLGAAPRPWATAAPSQQMQPALQGQTETIPPVQRKQDDQATATQLQKPADRQRQPVERKAGNVVRVVSEEKIDRIVLTINIKQSIIGPFDLVVRNSWVENPGNTGDAVGLDDGTRKAPNLRRKLSGFLLEKGFTADVVEPNAEIIEKVVRAQLGLEV